MTAAEMMLDLSDLVVGQQNRITTLEASISDLENKINAHTSLLTGETSESVKASIVDAICVMGGEASMELGYEALTAAVKELPLEFVDRVGQLKTKFHYVAKSALQLKMYGSEARESGATVLFSVTGSDSIVPIKQQLDEVSSWVFEFSSFYVEGTRRAPETRTINVAVTVTPEEGMDQEIVRAAVEAKLRNWFDGQLLGQQILRAKLSDLIYTVEGVENYRILAPAADISSVSNIQLPRLGSMSVALAE